MVLTKSELIGSLQHEVHILLHLASKVDRGQLDYRPTPKQRSTLELLKYLSIMGPGLVQAVKRGGFDPAAWTVLQQQADARDFDQTLSAIGAQADLYALELGSLSDEDFRTSIDMFGTKTTVGAFITNLVLCGIPDAAVLLPEGVRPRRTEHDESVGRHRRAGARVARARRLAIIIRA